MRWFEKPSTWSVDDVPHDNQRVRVRGEGFGSEVEAAPKKRDEG